MKLVNKTLITAIIVLFIANFFLFWRFYLKGLLPFPGDLLVSYYFPWSSGGFTGFDSWTTRKGVMAMDVIRQMYPWKDFVVDQIKSGQWPLWNPYNFSGTPLLANMQSSIFFPGNFIFLLLPKIWGWISLVIGLPFVFSFFCYLFLKSMKLNNFASIFGAIAMSNIGYLTVWAEHLIVIQSVFFLPLILLFVNLFTETKKHFIFWLIPILLAFSFFGGHPQSIAYVYLITLLYCIYKKVSLPKIFLCFIFALGISALQLLPSLELYRLSARENYFQRQLILTAALPWKNLSTIFAPDYFGSPATFNFRGMNYDGFQAYFGVAAFLLALYGIFKKESKFFLSLAAFGLLFALPPLAYIGVWLNIPILSSGFPSRIIFIFGFAMAVLSAFGVDYLLGKNIKASKKFFIPIIVTATAFAIIAVATFSFSKPDQIVSLKNMIVPSMTFLIATIAFAFAIIKKRRIFVFLIIAAGIFEYSYLFNKLQPFAPLKFVFPNHPVFSFLQTTGADRYFGIDRAYIDSNFATYYRIYTPEGYDPLYIKNYGEFLAGSNNGKFPKDPPPSDAIAGKTDNQFRKKLFDILAVKYLIDKTDDPQKDYGPNVDRFPLSEYTFIKQVNKWKYYERKTALPRVFLSGSYQLETGPKKTIETFYDPAFDPKTILLSEKPTTEPSQDKQGVAQIVKYSPNKVVINTSSLSPKLLFLSDNYYPGWIATIDEKETPILKADYTFRAVALPAGNHTVRFEYRPLSFKLGLLISLASLSLISVLIFRRRKIYA